MATTPSKSADDYAVFKIHPAIGIARLGDSPDQIMLAPEGWRELPIDANSDGTPVVKDGKEQHTNQMRDAHGKVKRQGARFQVFAYQPGQAPAEVQIGQELTVLREKAGQVMQGKLLDIAFDVYLANKKSVWYQFQELDGQYGYAPDHPRRNADIQDPAARQGLITDPGPVTVAWVKEDAPHHQSFARGANSNQPQSYPPPTVPHTVETLGDVLVTRQGNTQRLVVLGGHGDSGSVRTGIGEPRINSFVNNDGWFDDVGDGPVRARLQFQVLAVNGQPPIVPQTVWVPVDQSAWVIVGYPRYAPQISDMVTLDETIFDVSVRNYAYAPEIFGVAPFTREANAPKTPAEWATWRKQARYNPDYVPHYWSQIWPILLRPNMFQWVYSFDGFAGGDPHNTGPGGNLDMKALSRPPQAGNDPGKGQRMFIEGILRKKGGENKYMLETTSQVNRLMYMPLLCGDNPITNVAASKFLRLTDTMLFLLKQWALGKFVNEQLEPALARPPLPAGEALDRGVLSNGLGGSFCPGGEVSWIIRNPAIYASPYRIHQADGYVPGSLSQNANYDAGLEPGDLTKYTGVPWQADFHECSVQDIDVTYEQWNELYPASVGEQLPQSVVSTVYWWPSHRPMTVYAGPNGPQVNWDAGLPDSYVGDLMMVQAWKNLGFVLNDSLDDPDQAPYYQQQRNPKLT